MKLKGQKILVVAGSSGFGLAIAYLQNRFTSGTVHHVDGGGRLS